MVRSRKRPKPNSAREVHLGVLRRMTPEEKLDRVFEIAEFAFELKLVGVRLRYPNITHDEVRRTAVAEMIECHNRNY